MCSSKSVPARNRPVCTGNQLERLDDGVAFVVPPSGGTACPHRSAIPPKGGTTNAHNEESPLRDLCLYRAARLLLRLPRGLWWQFSSEWIITLHADLSAAKNIRTERMKLDTE